MIFITLSPRKPHPYQTHRLKRRVWWVYKGQRGYWSMAGGGKKYHLLVHLLVLLLVLCYQLNFWKAETAYSQLGK